MPLFFMVLRSRVMPSLLFSAIMVFPAWSQMMLLEIYSTREGVVSNIAQAIQQDSRGYLWIGTGDGVSRYDGTSFRNYTVNDGLPSSFITCVAETPGQVPTIWFGTNGAGLAKIVGSTVTAVAPDTGEAARFILDLAVDSAGVLWCATRAGVFIIANDSVRPFLRSPGTGIPVQIALSTDQTLWVAIGDRILLYASRTPDHPPREIRLPDGKRTGVLAAGREGDMWISTSDNTVLRYRDGQLLQSRGITTASVVAMTEDHDGNLWVAANAGLLTVPKSRFMDAPVVRYGMEHGLPENRLRSVYCDRENNLWIGSHSGGTVKWSHRNILNFPIKEISDAYNNGRAIVDSSGHCWVATRSGLVEIWKDAQSRWNRKEHRLIDDPRKTPVRFIVLDRSGDFWIDVMGEGIHRYAIDRRSDGVSTIRRVHSIREGKELPAGPRQGMLIDRHGLAWVSTHTVGVSVVDISTSRLVKTYTPDDGSPGFSVRALHEDAEGNVWVGGFSEGVAIFPSGAAGGKPVRRLDATLFLPDNHIRAFAADYRGRIWIGMRYGGLAVIEEGTVRALGMKDGLISNSIWALTGGVDNTLWCGTSLGVQNVDTKTLQPLEGSPAFTGESINSCGMFRDQFLWYVTPSSLVIHESPEHRLPIPPPPTHITAVQVNGRPIDHDRMLEYSHREHTWTIEYAGISFRDQKALRYRYRLIGLDQEWGTATAQRSVTYAALAPGTYTFEVMTLVGSTTFEATRARLSFSILPPLWQRAWFIASSLLLAGSIVGMILRARANRKRREEERQVELSRQFVESQEAERRRIAHELHDSLGQELLVLKSDLQHLASHLEEKGEVARGLAKLSEDVMQSINEVRQISYDLHPHVLERLGLRRAIESIVTKTSQSSGLAISSSVDAIDNLLPKPMEINLYRIVQEGLNNIIKHAGASEAVLEIARHDGGIAIRLQDNGRGFDSGRLDKDRGRPGLGLAGIAERVRLSGGTWSITSRVGGGTTLQVTVPVEGGKEL